MRCAQQPRGLPPWARGGARFLVVRVECSCPRKPGATLRFARTAKKRGHAGTADHHMRAGGIQERKDLLYAACHAVSSPVLEKLLRLRYNVAPAPIFGPDHGLHRA